MLHRKFPSRLFYRVKSHNDLVTAMLVEILYLRGNSLLSAYREARKINRGEIIMT